MYNGEWSLFYIYNESRNWFQTNGKYLLGGVVFILVVALIAVSNQGSGNFDNSEEHGLELTSGLGKGRTPVSCTPTAVEIPDACQVFAPKDDEATTECQESLKGGDYLKICTFTNGVKEEKAYSHRPKPNKKCHKVKCHHPCYIPCVYFIARNRSFKADPKKEFKLMEPVTYSCHNGKDEYCGCASVVH